MRDFRWVALSVVAGSTFAAREAGAAPGDWSMAIERVFGLSRVKDRVEVSPGVEVTTESTALSLGSKISRGYSPARFAVDYLVSSGLTVGGAIGYESIGDDGDDDADWWLFAARVGYLATLGDGAGIWPRGGFTYTSYDPGGEATTATALTLEVPFVIFALGHRVGFQIIPYADIGVGGGTGDLDRTLTEFGLQFGLGAFF